MEAPPVSERASWNSYLAGDRNLGPPRSHIARRDENEGQTKTLTISALSRWRCESLVAISGKGRLARANELAGFGYGGSLLFLDALLVESKSSAQLPEVEPVERHIEYSI